MSTPSGLKIRARQIKEASQAGENTAERVGGLLEDLVDYTEGISVDKAQSDWDETDSANPSYIKNKPDISQGVVVDDTLSEISENSVQNKVVTSCLINKQDKLYNGVNIRTINGNAILGEGNLEINSGNSVAVDAKLSSESENPVQNKVITNSISSIVRNLDSKQTKLQDGVNIKTINGEPILGGGDIVIQGGVTVIVDSELSKTSSNPVQNKVITEALEGVGDTPNKEYDPENHSGLGRKILGLKNNSNVLLNEDFDKTNTVYVISYDFVLGEDITVPAGCILDFDGGSLSNTADRTKENRYALNGTYTKVRADKTAIFTNMTIGGTWNIPNIYSVWFSDIANDNELRQLINLSNDDIWNDIYVEDGTYIVSVGAYKGKALVFKSNTNFHNSGTIKLLPNGFEDYNILYVQPGVENVHIVGGSVIGDAMEHDYSLRQTDEGTHQWGRGITIKGTKCSVSFTDVTYCTGDSYNVTDGKDCRLFNFSASYSRRQGVTVGHGVENLEIRNFHIAHIGNLPTDEEIKKGTNPRSAIDIEPNKSNTEAAVNITIDNGIVEDCRHAVEWLRSDNYSQNINLTVSNIIVKNPYGTSFPLRGEHITLRNIKQVDDNPDETLDFIDLRSATSSQKIILENIETFGEIEDTDLPPSTDLIPGRSCIITNSSFSRIVTNGNWEINNCSLSKASCESGITRINNSTISNPGYAIIGNTTHTEYTRGLILNNCTVISEGGSCVYLRNGSDGFAEFYNCKFYHTPENVALRGNTSSYTLIENCNDYSIDNHELPFSTSFSGTPCAVVRYTRPKYLYGSVLPEITSGYSAGHRFFHTGLSKNLYWNGSYWINDAGTRISYSISHSLTNIYASSYKAPRVGESYTVTLSVSEGYSLPSTITVKMGGTVLKSGTGYTYNSSTGKIVIGSSGGVTGDLEITAAGVTTG